jgi:uncharacterized protein (TIGR03437 family)
MHSNRLLKLAVPVLMALSAVPVLLGTQYTFTKVTDDAPGSTLGLTSFIGPYLINNSGTVAFTAEPSSTLERGVYVGSGDGTIKTVFVGGLTVGSPRVGAATGFNDSGTVVYTAGAGVYTGTAAGATPFQVASQTGSSTILPGINNAGTVAYGVMNNQILTRTGTADAQTLVSDTELPRANELLAPSLAGLSINNSGTVAFFATSVKTSAGSCNCGIFTKATSGGAAEATPFIANINISPQINDNGAVAFAGLYQGTKGVFVASGGQIGAVVNLGTQTVSLDTKNVSLNSKGEVAYHAKFGISPFVQGIFTGPDKVADKVIANGDPLFDSVVEEILVPQTPGRFLNDKGEIAFGYRLTNGLAGVAVATPVSSGAAPPKIFDSGVVNGASFASGAAVAPGAIVSIFGTNFISQLTVPPSTPGPLPTSLGGASVTFDGVPAPLFFVAPGQINAQVPYGVSGSTATVQVSTPAGTSNTETINITPQSPAIFTTDQTGFGQGVVVFANSTTIVGPVVSGRDWRPGKAGDTITIYINGLGAVDPPINDGWNSCDLSICAPDFSNLKLRTTTVRPVVKIGNVTVPDGNILYSGLTPLFAGLYQINVTIPDGITPANNVPVVVQMGNTTTGDGVHIGLQ